MAIGGEFETRENGSNKPNPLPSLAASCAHNEMVRRGRRFEPSEGFNKGLVTGPFQWAAVVGTET